MSRESHETRQVDGFRHLDVLVAEEARRNYGVVGRRALLAIGMREDQIEFRLRTRRLVRVHSGVYAAGAVPLGHRGRWRAATLAIPGAVVSHRDAAALWDLLTPRGPAVHVTAPRRARRRPDLHPHRRTLPTDEVTAIDGIPVTSLSRTLLDVAATEGLNPLESALRIAERRRLGDPVGLAGLLRRYPARAGTGIARRALARAVYVRHTRSELEQRFLELLAARGRPLPLTNQVIETRIGRLEVDCVWPGHPLVVELDGWWTHGDRDAFERDRRRDAALLAAGRPVIRLTWERVAGDPAGVDAELAPHLGWN